MLTRIISRFWSHFFCRGSGEGTPASGSAQGRIDSRRIYPKRHSLAYARSVLPNHGATGLGGRE